MRHAAHSNLVFIHIPKNGGQSVRNALNQTTGLSYAALAQDLDVSQEVAAELVEKGYDHPALGRIHPAHLTLAMMRDHFPASWAVVNQCHSFALTREPRARFISALMQRMKEFRNAGQIRVDDAAVAQEATEVCAWLDGKTAFSDLEYIHFTPQTHFTDLDGARVLDAIFPVSASDALAAWTLETVGVEINIKKDHARRQPKSWGRAVQPIARFAGRRILPKSVKRALHPLWMNSRVFADAASDYAKVDFGADVETFIASYYAADAALHAEAQSAATAWRPETAA